ncbi:TPA_asm: non-structural polyprotein [Patiria miniata associated picornavirus 1]|nr:TPA_asm: non-structural polyprotein [Patiria miniata associated picornavirus 1]
MDTELIERTKAVLSSSQTPLIDQSKIPKVIENLIIIIMQCAQSASQKDCIYHILNRLTIIGIQYHDDPSYSIEAQFITIIKKLIDSMFSASNAETTNPFSYFKQKWYELMDSPGREYDVLFKFVYLIASQIYSCIFGFGIDYDKLWNGFTDFKEFLSRKGSKSLFQWVTEFILEHLEKGWNWATGCNSEDTITTVSSYIEFLEMSRQMRDEFKYLSNKDDSRNCFKRYRTQLSKLLYSGEAIYARMQHRNIRKFQQDVRVELGELRSLYEKMSSYDFATKESVSPFSLLIHGEPGVGKSYLVDIIKHALFASSNRSDTESGWYVKQNSSKFWDGLQPYHEGVIFDDLGKEHKNTVTEETYAGLIDVINPVPKIANMADITDKGRVFLNFDYVLATSNKIDFGARTAFSTPFAAIRRFPYVITVEVKDEFRVNDASILDKSVLREYKQQNPMDQDPEIQNFILQHVIENPGSNTWEYDIIETFTRRGDLIKALISLCDSHFYNEKVVSGFRKELLSSTMCKCGSITRYCICPSDAKIDEVDDEEIYEFQFDIPPPEFKFITMEPEQYDGVGFVREGTITKPLIAEFNSTHDHSDQEFWEINGIHCRDPLLGFFTYRRLSIRLDAFHSPFSTHHDILDDPIGIPSPDFLSRGWDYLDNYLPGYGVVSYINGFHTFVSQDHSAILVPQEGDFIVFDYLSSQWLIISSEFSRSLYNEGFDVTWTPERILGTTLFLQDLDDSYQTMSGILTLFHATDAIKKTFPSREVGEYVNVDKLILTKLGTLALATTAVALASGIIIDTSSSLLAILGYQLNINSELSYNNSLIYLDSFFNPYRKCRDIYYQIKSGALTYSDLMHRYSNYRSFIRNRAMELDAIMASMVAYIESFKLSYAKMIISFLVVLKGASYCFHQEEIPLDPPPEHDMSEEWRNCTSNLPPPLLYEYDHDDQPTLSQRDGKNNSEEWHRNLNIKHPLLYDNKSRTMPLRVIKERVLYSTGHVFISREASGFDNPAGLHGVIIKSNILMFPAHILSALPEDEEIKFIYKPLYTGHFLEEEYSMVTHKHDIHIIGGSDRAYIQLLDYNPRYDILDLLTDTEIDGNHDILYQTINLSDNHIHVVNGVSRGIDPNFTYYGENIAFTGDIIKLHANVQPGDCGNLVIFKIGNFYTIGGYIVAGHVAAPYGGARPITKTLISDEIEIFYSTGPLGLVDPGVFPKIQDGPNIHYKSRFAYIANGYGTLYGKMDTRYMPKPAMQRSDYYKDVTDNFGPTPFVVPNFHRGYNDKGVWIDPMFPGLAPRLSRPPVVNKDIISIAAYDYARTLLLNYKDIKEMVKPLNYRAAINGLPGLDSINSINRNTSAGYGLPGKKYDYLIPQQSWSPDEVIFTDELSTELWKMDKLITGRIRLNPVFETFLKPDEVVKQEKADIGKYRVFTGCPMLFNILLRKYYLPIVRFLLHNRSSSEMAVGINVEGQDWDTLYQDFSDHPHMFDMDFKSFDSSLSKTLLSYGYMVLIRIAKFSGNYSRAHINAMETLAHDVIHFYCKCDDVLLSFPKGNGSGQAMTTIINCVANSIILRIAWIVLGNDVSDFSNQVKARTFGDDLIVGLSNPNSNFTMSNVIRAVTTVGMKATPGRKDATVASSWLSISEVSFLKRRFVPTLLDNGVTVILAPLDQTSIMKSFYFVNKQSPLSCYDALHESCCRALVEFYYHHDYIMMEKIREFHAKKLAVKFPDLTLKTNDEIEEYIMKQKCL